MSKLIVFTAPSGAGKTTIVRHLIKTLPDLSFSVSATTRYQRPNEVNAKDYYFLSAEDFKAKIREEAFVEWEEVYHNQYYGTLKSEIKRLWDLNQNIIFDIDVQGALRIKQAYPEKTLTIFVRPPSLETLIERLTARNTEAPEQLEKRIAKASYELSFDERFDYILLNDELSVALKEAEKVVRAFIQSPRL